MSFRYNPSANANALVYIVKRDTGLAPNITGGDWCTLAVCKPVVRRMARAGIDWVVGVGDKDFGRDRIVYAMPVQENLTFAEYWNDPRFADKRPDSDPNGDNIYYPDPETGEMILAGNRRHISAQDYRTDLGKEHEKPQVLASDTFWYFGDKAPQLPTHYHDTALYIPGHDSGRGHRRLTDQQTLQAFAKWLTENYETGIHGQPRHPERMVKRTYNEAVQHARSIPDWNQQKQALMPMAMRLS